MVARDWNGSTRERRNATRPPRVLRYDEYAASAEAEPETAANRAPIAGGDPWKLAFDDEYYRRVRRRHERALESESAGAAAQPPSDAVTDDLTDHNYDGIQEYDNPTPGWWYMLFVLSVVFSGIYVLIYHSPMVPSLGQRHAAAETRQLDLQFAELNGLEMGEEKILAIMAKEEWLRQGAAIFKGACVTCHGADASGGIGADLTDDYYRNVVSLTDIATAVADGLGKGAMPPQKNLLNENEIALVSAYVASLRGSRAQTNPAVNPEYLGGPIPEWPALTESGEIRRPAPDDRVSMTD